MRKVYNSWYLYEDGYYHLVYNDSVYQDYDLELAEANKSRLARNLLGMERTLCGLILHFSDKRSPSGTCLNCKNVFTMLELSS